MKITLEDTTSSAIASRLVRLREEGGAVALGRVLTLLVQAHPDEVESAVHATNAASREHPCRVIVVATDDSTEAAADGLDAEIRVGADAGASEVIVLRPRGGAATELDSLVTPLLLPDTPIVAWWPGSPPEVPSRDPLGSIAQRRITDALSCTDPIGRLTLLADGYAPGDTDLAWARATLWRGLLASALDDASHGRVRSVTIAGNLDHPSISLIGGWLADALECEIHFEAIEGAEAMVRIVLGREDGETVFERPVGSTILHITEPSGISHRVSLPLRSVEDSLIEDLRRLDEDVVYGEVLTHALPLALRELAKVTP
ncbi:glucose-6-phosphate dehydrogenase assembly protein OpcA [Salana multivorans]|uniref:Glucose-6-phosphate dehydrogenase assembly protein OpcA n=1 Tax=Salana multivorans TaxID=120377 RepID=A0A3N2D133_9MICO|nr:glucose-6-phosphate dehydrogenase assembly protein OpcA [Salana multivorans]ROR93482.1 glucose-6-phosphate dehydrogenase assembly protein OpcA [Salana multivorans]